MPAGVVYNTNPFDVEKELYAIETGYRYKGGFNLDIANLPSGVELPTLCPLYIDFATRKAYVVKNIKVYEEALEDATSIKIAKGNYVKVGDIYNISSEASITISAIDNSNANYDTITISVALDADLQANTILTGTYTANALNYARTKAVVGATVTALGQAYEIKESELYCVISEADKTILTSRFMFI